MTIYLDKPGGSSSLINLVTHPSPSVTLKSGCERVKLKPLIRLDPGESNIALKEDEIAALNLT